MSTNISPAFRVSSDTDLFALSDSLRETLTPFIVSRFKRDVLSSLVRSFDSNENKDSTASFAEYLKTSLAKLRGFSRKDDSVDFTDILAVHDEISKFQAFFIQNKVRNETYLLLSPIGLGSEGKEAVLTVKGIDSDYSYWNSSDSQVNGSGPNLISMDEWEDRKVAWGETLNYGKDVSEQGLVVKFFGSYSAHCLFALSEFEGQMDTLLSSDFNEDRFRRLVFNKYLEGIMKADPSLDVMYLISDSYKFFWADSERDYGVLPLVDTNKELLNEAVRLAEARVAAFPVVF